jgi:hypothetical protein
MTFWRPGSQQILHNFDSFVTQSLVSGLAALASPCISRSLLEMQTSGTIPELLDQHLTLRRSPGIQMCIKV